MTRQQKLNEIIQIAKQLVSETDGSEVLIYLERETDYSRCSSEITLFKARLSQIERSEIRNELKKEDIQIQRNNFSAGLIKFIDTLKVSDLKKEVRTKRASSFVKIWLFTYLEERKQVLTAVLKKRKFKVDLPQHELPSERQPILVLFDTTGIVTHSECTDFEKLSSKEQKHLWLFLRLLFLVHHPIIYIGAASFIADEFSRRFAKATDTSLPAILEEQIELVEQKFEV